VLPWFENRKKELANRPLIREQALGEALDPDKLEQLGRYEVHLDRKLERMLTMLLRLKELRRAAVEDAKPARSLSLPVSCLTAIAISWWRWRPATRYRPSIRRASSS
jgi:hypothetical protein